MIFIKQRIAKANSVLYSDSLFGFSLSDICVMTGGSNPLAVDTSFSPHTSVS